MPLSQEKQSYTYADYLTWDESERIELIDGEPVMHATPSRRHQAISRELMVRLYEFLKGKPCQVFAAPFSVRLEAKADDSDDTVLEPDIVVVCDEKKLDDRGCNGAPDFVVEISSPSTVRYDRMVKFEKYRKAGVREYWIVDPDTRSVQACILDGGMYYVQMYGDTGSAPVKVLPGCEVDLEGIFAE